MLENWEGKVMKTFINCGKSFCWEKILQYWSNSNTELVHVVLQVCSSEGEKHAYDFEAWSKKTEFSNAVSYKNP